MRAIAGQAGISAVAQGAGVDENNSQASMRLQEETPQNKMTEIETCSNPITSSPSLNICTLLCLRKMTWALPIQRHCSSPTSQPSQAPVCYSYRIAPQTPYCGFVWPCFQLVRAFLWRNELIKISRWCYNLRKGHDAVTIECDIIMILLRIEKSSGIICEYQTKFEIEVLWDLIDLVPLHLTIFIRRLNNLAMCMQIVIGTNAFLLLI